MLPNHSTRPDITSTFIFKFMRPYKQKPPKFGSKSSCIVVTESTHPNWLRRELSKWKIVLCYDKETSVQCQKCTWTDPEWSATGFIYREAQSATLSLWIPLSFELSKSWKFFFHVEGQQCSTSLRGNISLLPLLVAASTSQLLAEDWTSNLAKASTSWPTTMERLLTPAPVSTAPAQNKRIPKFSSPLSPKPPVTFQITHNYTSHLLRCPWK